MIDGSSVDDHVEMSEHEYQTVMTVLTVCRENMGWPTPGEEFISDLLIHRTVRGRELSPKEIEEAVEKFRSDFDDLVSAAKNLVRYHPTEIGLARSAAA
jgi:hypothetical protein